MVFGRRCGVVESRCKKGEIDAVGLAQISSPGAAVLSERHPDGIPFYNVIHHVIVVRNPPGITASDTVVGKPDRGVGGAHIIGLGDGHGIYPLRWWKSIRG